MTGAEDRPDLHLRLRYLEHWWKLTENPLYAWEAIAFSLDAEPPVAIPAWCLPYLAEAARSITQMAWSYSKTLQKASIKDVAELGKVELEGIKRLLPSKLRLIEERKKNAFSQSFEDGRNARAALDTEYGFAQRVPPRPTSDARTARLLARGRKLNGKNETA